MAEGTKIEWADHTFNPWIGCQKVGPGCDHCYAEALDARYAKGTMIAPHWGPGAPRKRTSEVTWKLPLKWNRQAAAFAEANGNRKQRVFCASLADVFDNEVDPNWRHDLFELIAKTPNLDWLLLTKRIGNVAKMVMGYPGRLPANVWLGATVVNQAEADRDIPKLLAAPATIRFLSMEPLLGPVDLEHLTVRPEEPCWRTVNALTGEHGHGSAMGYTLTGTHGQRVDWVIVGGETGTGSRPMHPGWVQSIRDQCEAAGVPFLFKQWGDWAPATDRPPERFISWDGKMTPAHEALPSPDDAGVAHYGNRRAGRKLLGRTYDGFPHA